METRIMTSPMSQADIAAQRKALADFIEKGEYASLDDLGTYNIALIVAALRQAAKEPDGAAQAGSVPLEAEAGDGTWQELMNLAARARARAHHHFLNSKTHDLFIECPEQLEAIAPTTAVPSAERCPYCSDGKRTGLPGNACENCMNTGLAHPSTHHRTTEGEQS